jgi:hypothetical protein
VTVLAFGRNSLGLRLGLLPGVLVLLPAGVRAELGLRDPGEAFVADDAVVPGGLAESTEGCADLGFVHDGLSHVCGIVSTSALDTAARLCYTRLVGSEKGDTR